MSGGNGSSSGTIKSGMWINNGVGGDGGNGSNGGDGINFNNSKFPFWGVKRGKNGFMKTIVKKIKIGDILYLGYEVIGIVLIGKDEHTYITEKSIWDENVENYKDIYNFHLITTDGLFYIFDKQKSKKVIDYSDTEYINVKNYPI